ncbi:MAG: S-layer homology domain-containing protein, partial [Clostridia bacterium]|nr:S-layer homology domain-containing protein [Clostridia bacterium]
MKVKRIISMVLCLALLLGMLPVAVFAETENTVIETINLTGVTLPAVGDAAVKNPPCTVEAGKGYTYKSSTYFDGGTQVTGTFKNAKTYTIQFNLSAEDGYEFADASDITATVNGGALSVKEVTVGNYYRKQDGATVVVEFTMPDNRIAVSEFVATSNMGVPTYGGDVKDYFDFTFTKGGEAYVTGSMGNWYKWDEEASEWDRYDEAKFIEGKYQYSNQLRIDGVNGATHRLAQTGVTVEIDGAVWTYDEEAIWVEPTYSYTYITSPEFTVEKVAIPLSLGDNHLYDIPTNFTGTPITSYSVKGGVIGGTEPYVFSKTSGPDWVTVAADGTVSGTPTVIGTNAELVIRVTDAESNYKEITVFVGKTNCDPADRIAVSEFVATSDMPTPAFGGEVKDYFDFTFTKGAEAYVTGSMGHWYKWDEGASEWKRYDEATFTVGKYYYSNQLRIDGVNGATHRLAQTGLTVEIDGAAWTYDEEAVWVEPTYSYTYISSPEYTVTAPVVIGAVNLTDVILPANGDTAVTNPPCTVEAGKGYIYSSSVYYDGGVQFTSIFNCAKTYTIKFNLKAEAGYEFADASDITVTVNGGALTVKEVSMGAYLRYNEGATVVVEFTPLHSLTAVPEVPATKTATGKQAYYHCSACNADFEDAAGTKKIDDIASWGIIPVLKPATNPFVDVKKKDYFYNAVLWAVDEGVTSGVDATHFGPNESCTRAQAVTFMWRAAGCPEPTNKTNPFTDVKKKDYYYKAVLWAVENGITAGASATTFAPNAPCTRGQ